MAGNGSSSSKEVDKGLKSLCKKLEKCLPLEKLKSLQNESTPIPCIHRVSDLLHEQNRDAYSPRSVSIGPLHRTNPTLYKMNDYKLAYMDRLFARIDNDASAREECMKCMIDREKEARNYYAEYVPSEECVPSEEHEFATMMLIDGCFVIELLYSSNFERTGKDPILDNNFMYHAVRHDLLLLENQIPFFVLEDLFELTVRKFEGNNSICDLVRSFFGDMMRDRDTKKKGGDSDTANHHILDILGNCYPRNPPPSEADERERGEDAEKKAGDTTYHHILDLLRKFYLPSIELKAKAGKGKEKENTEKKHRKFKSSATTLDLAGVNLKGVTNTTESLFFDVKFTTVCCFPFCRKKWSCSCCHLGLFKSNYLEIPTFAIYDSTESFLRNVIAFEQCSHGISRHFTSFAILMDRLVDSVKDIELLKRGGVLCNNLGSSEEAKHLFNNIGKHVAVDDEMYFDKECARVEEYLERRSPRFITALKRDYFSSPWTIISVCAAIVLFVLTLLQTTYSMLSYY